MFKTVTVTAALLLASQAAFAGPQCNSPKDQWQDQAKFQESLRTQGYQIKNFKISKGQCYEIYGHDKAGQRVEIYFDPVSGKVLQVK